MRIIILVLMMLVGSIICSFLREKLDNEVPKRGKRALYRWGGKWPKGTIPYVLDPATKFTTQETKNILSGMATITSATGNCIKFVPRKKEYDYLWITGIRTGCWSYIGKIGKNQTISLNRKSCLGPRAILHELAHVIGMIHEHQRPDRHQFVNISWDNVLDGKERDFTQYSYYEVFSYNHTYDYYSVTHYRAYSHNKNTKLPVMVPIDKSIIITDLGGKPSSLPTLSKIDVGKIKAHYNCT